MAIDADTIRTPEQLGFTYRHSSLREGEVVARASFHLTPADPDDIRATLASIRERRREAQPSGIKTFGSTFKNPPGDKAWRLIDAAGCRGLTMGGAQVSEKHCNFLINLGNATSTEIEALGEEVRRRVADQSNVSLEWEIQRVGQP